MSPHTPRSLRVARRRRTIDDVLEQARSRLDRLTPEQARDALATDPDHTVLVDIRPVEQRRIEGELADALPVERNVLEWRFDPASEGALPIADHDLRVIVICSEGYTSSLAADALADLGIHRATDVIGGYAAYRRLADADAMIAASSSRRGPSCSGGRQPVA